MEKRSLSLPETPLMVRCPCHQRLRGKNNPEVNKYPTSLNPLCCFQDLEFSRALNPDKDGPAAIQSLLEALSCLLQEELGMSLDIADVVELDSSTPSKFSRHLILRIPGHAFASNAHVGALVRQLCARARKRGPDGPLAIVADSPHLNV